MVLTLLLITKLPTVLALISSTLIPGAYSNKARSVITLLIQATPVSGRLLLPSSFASAYLIVAIKKYFLRNMKSALQPLL